MRKVKDVFLIQVEDVQDIASDYIGRELTDEELYRVKKGIESGFSNWDEIVRSAIWDVMNLKDLDENYEKIKE